MNDNKTSNKIFNLRGQAWVGAGAAVDGVARGAEHERYLRVDLNDQLLQDAAALLTCTTKN